MAKAKRPRKRTKASNPFTKLCTCGHYNHNRKSTCELCNTPLPTKKKKQKKAPPKKTQQTNAYSEFQTKSAAAFEYLTTFNGDFDQAVEFLSALKPLVTPNKSS